MRKALVLITTAVILAEETVLNFLKSIAGKVKPEFVCIRNYENNQGEISNYVLNLGVDYGKTKAKDIEKLQDRANFKNVQFGGIAVAMQAETAREALLYSMTHESNQSKGQQTAYLTIAPNIRLHLESNKLMVYGFKVSKTVLVEGKYKAVNSSFLTLAKNAIRNELLTTNFRQFQLDKIKSVRMEGKTMVIDL